MESKLFCNMLLHRNSYNHIPAFLVVRYELLFSSSLTPQETELKMALDSGVAACNDLTVMNSP